MHDSKTPGPLKPSVIGLTGLIASGKSHIAEIFRGFGAAVQDSDKVAHALLEGEAFEAVAKQFPQVVEAGKINRQLLGKEVFYNEEKFNQLEKILHPLVREKNLEFISQHKDKMVVLEIPLLFETKADHICNYVVFANVKPKTQRARALARQGMTPEKLEKILERQNRIPINEKLRNADFVIENEPGTDTLSQVKQVIDKISRK